jgi:hypothetical protein
LIGHPPFSSISSFLKLGKPLSRPAAKVISATIWGFLFAAKAYKTHWIGQPKVERTNGPAEKDPSQESRIKKRK